MKRILFIDLQEELIQDLEIANLINAADNNDYELRCISSVENMEHLIGSFQPDVLILSYSAMLLRDSWHFDGVQVAFYAKNREELDKGAEYGLPTVGIAPDVTTLSRKIGDTPYPVHRKGKNTDTVPQGREQVESGKSFTSSKDIDKVKKDTRKAEDLKLQKPAKPQVSKKRELEVIDDLPFDNEEPDEADTMSYEDEGRRLEMKESHKVPETEKSNRNVVITEDIVGLEYRHDLKGKEKGTKVIATCSAKGGVGKTTIASELAVYLSLVTLGRRKLRVCIVDYNIDFGDVRSTLGIDDTECNLAYWAAEVRELLNTGKRAEDIQYSRKDVEDWLYYEKKSGLYVLPAPLTNEDSMNIEEDELNIILDNIVQNGEFDYVICDTGNNTRDSTLIALEHADIILLIMTQNINTANCDNAFIQTMDAININTDGMKLVINNIMPERSTYISVQEIISYFPYDCVGKLRFNTDVIRATNLGKPLAFQPGHEFTKQMREIVAYVLGQDEFTEDTKKKKLFGFLSKKKR